MDSDLLQSFPLRSVGRIRAEQPNGPLSVMTGGTGVMIGPRHVLTAAHTIIVDLEAFGGPSGFTNLVTDTESCGGTGLPCFEVTFGPGELDRNTMLNGEPRAVVSAFVDPTYIELPNFNYDYAVLILEDEVRTASLGWWELCTPSAEFMETASLALTGYPGIGNTCEHSPNPDGLCAGLMYRQESCSATEVQPLLFFHACDAQKGQSGAPISVGCPVGVPCVVGVHGGGGVENNAARLTPDRIQLIKNEALCAFPSTHAADPRCP